MPNPITDRNIRDFDTRVENVTLFVRLYGILSCPFLSFLFLSSPPAQTRGLILTVDGSKSVDWRKEAISAFCMFESFQTIIIYKGLISPSNGCRVNKENDTCKTAQIFVRANGGY